METDFSLALLKPIIKGFVDPSLEEIRRKNGEVVCV